ncbi:MAG: bifunctional riboflavin kinase/FAD synthetase [Clostridia bacterium]|nr:bifunctional riboflavin kinase/FAD synthetase [Clostridia bacterium]
MTDKKLNNGCAVALGNFDGLHIGHLAVIDRTIALAGESMTATVMLFDEHSMKAVTGAAPPRLITEEERADIFKKNGIEPFVISFSRIKDFSPKEFVEKVLVSELDARIVVCGFNYRFGNKAKGDAKLLEEICIEKGIKCVIINEVVKDGMPISSTAIRNAVECGDIEKANAMLGRSFGYCTEVINGDKRGRTWGFPTINQKLPEGFVVPKFGVYESIVTVEGQRYLGVTNIGLRPTVGTEKVLSETHILSFDGVLYGKKVDVRLIRFIRSEQKFSSFDELILQIESDVNSVKGGA